MMMKRWAPTSRPIFFHPSSNLRAPPPPRSRLSTRLFSFTFSSSIQHY
jgi:hypothetical protein